MSTRNSNSSIVDSGAYIGLIYIVFSGYIIDRRGVLAVMAVNLGYLPIALAVRMPYAADPGALAAGTATLGMMLMAATADLISVYLSLELTSISLYVLVGFLKDRKSTEASLTAPPE